MDRIRDTGIEVEGHNGRMFYPETDVGLRYTSWSAHAAGQFRSTVLKTLGQSSKFKQCSIDTSLKMTVDVMKEWRNCDHFGLEPKLRAGMGTH